MLRRTFGETRRHQRRAPPGAVVRADGLAATARDVRDVRPVAPRAIQHGHARRAPQRLHVEHLHVQRPTAEVGLGLVHPAFHDHGRAPHGRSVDALLGAAGQEAPRLFHVARPAHGPRRRRRVVGEPGVQGGGAPEKRSLSLPLGLGEEQRCELEQPHQHLCRLPFQSIGLTCCPMTSPSRRVA